MKRYKSCKECHQYSKCVKEADLRRKRNRCKFAIHPKQVKEVLNNGTEN